MNLKSFQSGDIKDTLANIEETKKYLKYRAENFS